MPPEIFSCTNVNKIKVAFEGNIGAGKSTILNHFKQFSSICETHDEPIKSWSNLDGINIFEKFNKDRKRWGLAFQSFVQLTISDIYQAKQTKKVKLYERSLQSAHYCFTKNLLNSGYLQKDEFNILDAWYNWIMTNFNFHLDLIVYMRASPEICLKRIKKRNRIGEENITLEYLKELHELHDNWLLRDQENLNTNTAVIIIDADQQYSDVVQEIKKCQHKILFGLTSI
ncbi:dCK [Intoshia linei]|uniref:DCK n=1 Tax=Intoshia linei TaxID=1819745 RepID=A0A177B166_9BILA|nr:dCK [Intoshia linei]